MAVIVNLNNEKIKAAARFNFGDFTISISTIFKPTTVCVFKNDSVIPLADFICVEDAIKWIHDPESVKPIYTY